MGRLARREPGVSLGAALGLLIVAAGLYIGMRPLDDNSFLTHLATGRMILDSSSVPSHDPYSFTAPNEPWVVQSWLASLIYATVEELAGPSGLRMLGGVLAASVAACGWALTRDARGVVVRLAIGATFVAVGAGAWHERPFMLGLLFLAVTLLVIERAWPPWVLLPIYWLWANVHGSYPLGLALLACIAVGRRLDGVSVRLPLRALGAAVLGMVAGVIGPIGFAVLTFPLDLLSQQDVLQNVTEWRSPSFQNGWTRAFLVMLVGAVAARVQRRSWQDTIPLMVFGALALTSVRNLAPAAIVLLPGLARGFGDVGSLRGDRRSVLSRGLAAAGIAMLAVVPVGQLSSEDYDLQPRYPVVALAHTQQVGIDLTELRMAVPDTTGNLMELLFGPAGIVFFDDRFDMFPLEMFEDNVTLVDGDPGWRSVLEGHGIDLVLWTDSGVGTILAASPEWRTLVDEPGHALYCRRGAELVSTLRC